MPTVMPTRTAARLMIAAGSPSEAPLSPARGSHRPRRLPEGRYLPASPRRTLAPATGFGSSGAVPPRSAVRPLHVHLSGRWRGRLVLPYGPLPPMSGSYYSRQASRRSPQALLCRLQEAPTELPEAGYLLKPLGHEGLITFDTLHALKEGSPAGHRSTQLQKPRALKLNVARDVAHGAPAAKPYLTDRLVERGQVLR